jgi:Tetratrico peptide repeat
MEDRIRSALASKDYALAQTLADDCLRQGVQAYGDVSEFSAFLALTLYSAGRFREAISILLKLLADTASDTHVKRYDRALRYYAAHPDEE